MFNFKNALMLCNGNKTHVFAMIILRHFPEISQAARNPMWYRVNDTHRENCVLLNSVQEFIETEAWLLLTFSYVYTIN